MDLDAVLAAGFSAAGLAEVRGGGSIDGESAREKNMLAVVFLKRQVGLPIDGLSESFKCVASNTVLSYTTIFFYCALILHAC
jgi:hypothetical protein